MTIRYFSRLNIHTHLSEKQKTEVMEILGADSVGSETSFEFFYTLGHDERTRLYNFVGQRFPERMLLLSNLSDEWAMISLSTLPEEMDDPSLENKLEAETLEGLRTVFGASVQTIKIEPIDPSKLT